MADLPPHTIKCPGCDHQFTVEIQADVERDDNNALVYILSIANADALTDDIDTHVATHAA